MKFKNLEQLLPFGYLYLVMLGIIKDGVSYYLIGVNIIQYSSLTDILLSPIAILTSHPLFLCFVLIFTLFFYLYVYYATKNIKKKWAQKLLSLSDSNTITEEEIKVQAGKKFISMVLVGFSCFFLGIGLGNGAVLSKRVDENKPKINCYLTNSESVRKPIELVSTTSLYIFYLEKDNKHVQISPIQNIQLLEVLNKEEREEVK